MPDSSASTSSKLELANHFLIAMPSMLDPVFGGAVVYICEHNADGALGVIINKPTDISMETLFERIELQPTMDLEQLAAMPDLLFGGPVQVERGFVLHAPLPGLIATLAISVDIALTTSKDVLEAVASGNGPERLLVALGCAGWSEGQLEEEIVRNGWLTVAADPVILFSTPVSQRFEAAVRLLGIDPVMLTGEAGHA